MVGSETQSVLMSCRESRRTLVCVVTGSVATCCGVTCLQGWEEDCGLVPEDLHEVDENDNAVGWRKDVPAI